MCACDMVCVRMCVFINICIYIHICICIYKNIFEYICTRDSFPLPHATYPPPLLLGGERGQAGKFDNSIARTS